MSEEYRATQVGRLDYINLQIGIYCKRKKWTQKDLAWHAHVSVRKIKRVENAIAINKVNLDVLYRIADALDVPITEFLKS